MQFKGPIYIYIFTFLFMTNFYISHQVVDSLSQITKIPSDDILDFATIIVQQVIDGNP